MRVMARMAQNQKLKKKEKKNGQFSVNRFAYEHFVY